MMGNPVPKSQKRPEAKTANDPETSKLWTTATKYFSITSYGLAREREALAEA